MDRTLIGHGMISANTEFPHRLEWDRMGRQGQSCRILAFSGKLTQVQFEDGFVALVDRRALRRRLQCLPSSSSLPSH